MVTGLIGIIVLGGLIVGPLLWRVRQDRRHDRAQAIQARARAALFRALGGESLVAVNVQAPIPWRAGRVVLSAPADYTWLLECAWRGVVAQVPADYELVVKPAAPAPRRSGSEDLALRRAA